MTIRQVTPFVLVLLRLITRLYLSKTRIVLVDAATFVDTVTSKYKNPSFLILHRLQQQQQHRLSVETSPLIGGPSWLPLHVKVKLENKNLYTHQWDLIPVNATSTITIQKLVTMQHVPSQIRYRVYHTGTPSSSNKDDMLSSVQQPLLSITYDAETVPNMSEDIPITIRKKSKSTENEFSVHQQKNFDKKNILSTDHHSLTTLQAHRFCQSYMTRTNMELHLITNNCWTFALQMVFHLSLPMQSNQQNSMNRTN